jgi:hypothetical protein
MKPKERRAMKERERETERDREREGGNIEMNNYFDP